MTFLLTLSTMYAILHTMKFLIQTIDGQVKHDFAFTLIESCNYHNWLNSDNTSQYILCDTIPTDTNACIPIDVNMNACVPIGSVEFVTDYLQKHYNYTPMPINIPNELLSHRFTKRTVVNGTEKDIIGNKFVKSNDKIKSFTEECSTAPPGNYQISDIIDIDSEWRCFVYKNKLVGLQNYSGDFCRFPSVSLINSMIEEYKSAPIAYTLDVGIGGIKGTFIIEVHDFFSCGLYGFSDHKILPFMFRDWFRQAVFNF